MNTGSWQRMALPGSNVRRSRQRAATGPVLFGLLLLAQGACTTLEGPDYGVYDHNEGFNRDSYEFSEAVDRHALVPVARGYQSIAPDLLETAISNFFANLRSLDSSANGFLQGKPGRGATDSLRFVINSTIGFLIIADIT